MEGQPANSSLAPVLSSHHTSNKHLRIFLKTDCVPGTSLDTLQDGAFELKTLIETEMKITNTRHNVICSTVEFVYDMQRV